MIVIKKSEMETRKIDENYTVHNIITGDASNKVSIAMGVADNVRIKTKNLRSDRIYHVLEGELKVECYENEAVLGPGDSVLIESNKPYLFSGKFRAIIINSPPFSLASEIHLSEGE